MHRRPTGLRIARATVGTASAAGFVGVLASFGPLATPVDEGEVARELAAPEAPVALASTEGSEPSSTSNTPAQLPRLRDPAVDARPAPSTLLRAEITTSSTTPVPFTTTTSTAAPTTSQAPAVPKAPAAQATTRPPATTAVAPSTAAPTPAAPTTAAPTTTAPTTVAPTSAAPTSAAPTTAAPTTAAPTTTTVAPSTTVTTISSSPSTTLPPLTGGSN